MRYWCFYSACRVIRGGMRVWRYDANTPVVNSLIIRLCIRMLYRGFTLHKRMDKQAGDHIKSGRKAYKDNTGEARTRI